MVVGSRQKRLAENYDEISDKIQKKIVLAFFETFKSRILNIMNARQGSWFHPKSFPEFLDL